LILLLGLENLSPERQSYNPFDRKENEPIKPDTVAERFMVAGGLPPAMQPATTELNGTWKSVLHLRKNDFHTICCYVHCS